MRTISLVIIGALAVLSCQTAPEGQRDEAPSSIVRAAYMFYTGGPGVAPAPLLAENTLRDLALGTSAEFLEKNRTWVARSDWRRDFKDLFDAAIRWKRETLAKGPAHIYRLSQEYRDRADARENQFDSLSYNLLRLAAKLGHADAKAELPQRRHPVDEPDRQAEWREMAHAGAVKNNYRWQIDLAQNYFRGHHIDKNLMKAYYWFLRAGANGANVVKLVPGLPAKLTPVERQKVRDWMVKGIVPEL